MITRVKGSYVIGYNGVDHEIIRDGEVVYENDTIIYVGKHYEGEVSKTEDAGNAVIMPGFIDLNALGDIDHDILHTEAFSNIRSSLNPSEEYFEKGTHEVMTAEEEAFKSLYAYTQLIMHGITTAMPITSTYYKKWADTVKISKTYQRFKGEDIITSPKTKKSNRTIQMPEFLCTQMQEFFKMQYGLKKKDRIFTVTKSYLHHEMDRGAKTAGVKRIRIHDLRHSHISLLIDMGFSAVAIADRVGHESIEITYRYAHLFPSKQKEMASKLDDINKGA